MAAAMGPSIPEAELADRIDVMLARLIASGANLDVRTSTAVIAAAAGPLADRGIIAREDGRFRVRERGLLRYYARTIEHLLPAPTPRA